MAGFKTPSPIATGALQPVTPAGSEIVVCRFSQSVAVADHVVGTRGVVGILPAGCVPLTAYVHAGVLGAGFKASFGVKGAGGALSTDAKDGGAAWIVDNVTGAAGGYLQASSPAMAAVQPVDYDRELILEVTGAGTAAGALSVNLLYHGA